MYARVCVRAPFFLQLYFDELTSLLVAEGSNEGADAQRVNIETDARYLVSEPKFSLIDL
jgi:hypothetical protein